ncbi:MAG TPA: deoxyribonuclease IV [Gemmatimonadaceae bacterium]|nr:deoxyribonuclease IV [Gemmatimonadaceae bacterium]
MTPSPSNGPLVGAHTLDAGGIPMAVRRAAAAGMRTLQIFTAIPKYYNEKVGVKPERVERFHAALDEAGIRARDVVVHAAYVLNTASGDDAKWERAAAGLAKELERSTALGCGAVCFHPGSAGDQPIEAAVGRVARAITGALERVDGGTRLLVENTAGAGRTVGRTPEEVAAILDLVPASLRARTGYGLDTCHLFASGHDIASSRASLGDVLDAFERATGEPPGFFHLNDSEGALGSNRDRHALIGDGEIGVEPFRWLLADPRARTVPLILETPQAVPEVADDDASADPFDARMVALVRELYATPGS